jgi:hypothetical protein
VLSIPALKNPPASRIEENRLQEVIFEKGGYIKEIYLDATLMKEFRVLNIVRERNFWPTGEYEGGF